jgi:hypothetical protein
LLGGATENENNSFTFLSLSYITALICIFRHGQSSKTIHKMKYFQRVELKM